MAVRVWWVNQGDTYRAAVRTRMLWAPLHASGGRDPHHWKRLDDVRVGDLVIHYSQGAVRALSSVIEGSRSASRPAILRGDDKWEEAGRQVQVDLQELDPPLALTDIPGATRISWGRDSAASPFDARGKIKQGYLYEIEEPILLEVMEAIGAAEVNGDALVAISAGTRPRGELVVAAGPDGQIVVGVRREHARLHHLVFEGQGVHRCDLCGRELPVSLLVLAHIKRRSAATDAEKLDGNIAMRACSLGCDDLFERGYVVVDDSGVIQPGVRSKRDVTSDLVDAVRALEGKRCRAFTRESAEYFAWHRANHS